MDSTRLKEILKAHEMWLAGEGGERADLSGADLIGANLRGATLSGADLRGANLRWATLSEADLGGADLSGADLRGANLHWADLTGANLRGADLRCADLSGTVGLLDPGEWLAANLERTDAGYVAYKAFGLHYAPPERWGRKPGDILSEVCHSDRALDCACGVNVATHDWPEIAEIPTHRILIRWEWLPGVVVPYHTDGKFRCSRCEIIGDEQG